MNILTSISVFALSAFIASVNSYFESCISERCFAMPLPNETKNFNDGKKWCKERSYNLATVNDTTTQKALSEFLNSAPPNGQLFIDLQLQQDADTWYLVNGNMYLGGIIDQNAKSYQLYGYLQTDGSTFYAPCSIPNNPRSFICEFEKTKCSVSSTDDHIYMERCFIKYDKENLTWYQARERCHNNDGDLAIFNYAPGTLFFPSPVPFETSWLDAGMSYWVGIRYKNWRWTPSESIGSDDEIIYTSWSKGYPNNNTYGCVCVDPSGDNSWNWVDCSCDETRQFVCLKNVPTTIPSTIITTSPTTTSGTTSVPFTNMTKYPSNALAIGLGAGIGGGVFLILLIVIIVVAVTLTRKRRRKSNENQSTAATPNTELTDSAQSEFYAHIVPSTQYPADNKAQNDVIYAKPEFPNSTLSGSDPNTIRQGRVKSIMLEGPSDFYANAASVS